MAASDDLVELIVAPDFVFEVQLFPRELSIQFFDALIGHGVAHRNRDLSRDARQQGKLAARKRVRAERSEAQRADDAVRRREWDRAHGHDAARPNEPAFWKAVEIRWRKHLRLAGLEHMTGRGAVKRALGGHLDVG